MDMTNMLMNFESLGRNCEFGLLQRHFAAEPLGLLRWASVGHRQLIAALENRFDGFGTPEQSEIIINRAEYWMRDTKFDIVSHTSIRETKADREYVAKKQYPLLSFLKEKLINNLTMSEKIFVYQHKHLPDDLLRRLHAAVQSYAPNLLLCVREQDGKHAAGTIEVLDETLMVGYIDREGIPGPNGWDISIEMWSEFCRQALQHWQALGHDVQ